MKKLLFRSVILVLIVVLVNLLKQFPAFVEQYYSNGLYPIISSIMRYGLGWIPFSVGDLFYVASIIFILRWVYIHRKSLFLFKNNPAQVYSNILLGISVIYLIFNFSWGFNYYRLPLHQSLDLDEAYTDDELINTVQFLINTSNQLHKKLQPDSLQKVAFNTPQNTLFDHAAIAFENTNSTYPIIHKLAPNSIKKSLLTIPLSYMGYSGYLNPITGEAHTNAYINNYKTPVLILHEMSHQLGFAKENEANFVAIVSGFNHPDPYFQYSSSIFGLRYCLNDLYKRSPELYEEIAKEIRPGIFKNYEELRIFWKSYEGTIEDISNATYNSYLKANNQPDGLKTYSYVVALLVNSHKKRAF